MSDEESNKNGNLILVAAASAAISGGGTHIVTSSDDVTSANIEDCRSFSEHAREHERANCEIEKTNILIRCKP